MAEERTDDNAMTEEEMFYSMQKSTTLSEEMKAAQAAARGEDVPFDFTGFYTHLPPEEKAYYAAVTFHKTPEKIPYASVALKNSENTLRDYGQKLAATKEPTDAEIERMVANALMKGWSSLSITGSDAFRARVEEIAARYSLPVLTKEQTQARTLETGKAYRSGRLLADFHNKATELTVHDGIPPSNKKERPAGRFLKRLALTTDKPMAKIGIVAGITAASILTNPVVGAVGMMAFGAYNMVRGAYLEMKGNQKKERERAAKVASFMAKGVPVPKHLQKRDRFRNLRPWLKMAGRTVLIYGGGAVLGASGALGISAGLAAYGLLKATGVTRDIKRWFMSKERRAEVPRMTPKERLKGGAQALVMMGAFLGASYLMSHVSLNRSNNNGTAQAAETKPMAEKQETNTQVREQAQQNPQQEGGGNMQLLNKDQQANTNEPGLRLADKPVVKEEHTGIRLADGKPATANEPAVKLTSSEQTHTQTQPQAQAQTNSGPGFSTADGRDPFVVLKEQAAGRGETAATQQTQAATGNPGFSTVDGRNPFDVLKEQTSGKPIANGPVGAQEHTGIQVANGQAGAQEHTGIQVAGGATKTTTHEYGSSTTYGDLEGGLRNKYDDYSTTVRTSADGNTTITTSSADRTQTSVGLDGIGGTATVDRTVRVEHTGDKASVKFEANPFATTTAGTKGGVGIDESNTGMHVGGSVQTNSGVTIEANTRLKIDDFKSAESIKDAGMGLLKSLRIKTGGSWSRSGGK